MISIVVPTLDGRESLLNRTKRSIDIHTDQPFEIIVIRNEPSYGHACKRGAALAKGDYLVLLADDIELISSTWSQAITSMADRGIVACPLVLDPDHSLQSCGAWREKLPDRQFVENSMAPTMTMEMYREFGPVPEIHYGDAAICDLARKSGYQIQVCYDYSFIHHIVVTSRDRDEELKRWRES